MTVTPIRPGIAPPERMTHAEPDPVIIQYLEELLEEARAGQIQGIVWASLHPGDLTSHGRAGCVTSAVIGKLEIAKMSVVKIALEEEETH